MTGPVIFLDVDGVICTALSYRLTKLLRIDWLRQIFDPVSLFWLRRLTAKFGARIILTSTWRDALTMEDDWGKALISNLYGRMEQNGTPIAGATPVITAKGSAIPITARRSGCCPRTVTNKKSGKRPVRGAEKRSLTRQAVRLPGKAPSIFMENQIGSGKVRGCPRVT